MSSTTAPAEIEVPREFLPAFVIASNLAVMQQVEALDNSLSLDYTEEGRREDDAALAVLENAMSERLAILRALDDGAAVSIEVLRRHVDRAMAHLDSVIYELAGNATAASEADLEHLATTAGILRNLSFWNAQNLREREAVTA